MPDVLNAERIIMNLYYAGHVLALSGVVLNRWW